MASIGSCPCQGQAELTDAMLNTADANAGRPKLPTALSTPMDWAASATSTRNGNMMRVSLTASSNFPHLRETGRQQRTNCGLKIIPASEIAPTASSSAVPTTGPVRRPRAGCRGQRAGEDGHERRRERAFRERSRARMGMRNASAKAS